MTSDAGLIPYRDPDEALGLFDSVSKEFSDVRTGRNIQHELENLLRQSFYSRLAGYEDVNDATRMSKYPVMRAITGKKKVKRNCRAMDQGSKVRPELDERYRLESKEKAIFNGFNFDMVNVGLIVI